MIFVALITVVAIVGAVAGVLTSGARSFRHLVPFSSGLLIGMASFVLLPEAVATSRPLLVLTLCAFGCGVFALLEGILHSALPAPHLKAVGFIPLLLAVSLHAMLDGWNIATAIEFPDRAMVWAFLAGMSIHKLTGGFAIGAVVLSAVRHRNRAVAWAAFCESLTAAGAGLQFLFRTRMGDQWTIWLLAVTGGSFLYLGYHSLQTARKGRGFWSALPAALAGIASIWLISLVKR
jgi:zinc transporter ZupT